MPGPYPIKIHKTTLHYRSGSSDKEYHLVTAQTADGREMLIKRWGKTATWGQMDVLTGAGARATRDRIHREKTSKGYEQTGSAHEIAETFAELNAHLPGYIRKLTPVQIDYLIPGHSIGAATSDAPMRRATPAPPPPSEAERYAANPLWGAFS